MTRATRSQLTLPDFDIGLGQSPLKAARTALRNNVNVSTSAATATDNDGEEGEGLKAGKRPLKADIYGTQERDVKRAKMSPQRACSEPHDEMRVRLLQTSNDPIEATDKGTLLFPIPSGCIPPVTVFQSNRAQSVPPNGCIPNVNLHHVPPSPWRSPSKHNPRLHIAPQPTVLAKVPVFNPFQSDNGDTAVRSEVDMSSPILQPIPPSSEPDSPIITLDDEHPLSPLTPVPLTPHPSKTLSAMNEDAGPLDSPTIARQAQSSSEASSLIPISSETPSRPRSKSQTAFASLQELVSTSSPVTPRGGVKSRMRSKTGHGADLSRTSEVPIKTEEDKQEGSSKAPDPKAQPSAFVGEVKDTVEPLKGKPPRKPISNNIPLGGRMTRSSSLRQQENSKRVESKTPRSAASTAQVGVVNPSTPGSVIRRRAMSVSSFAQPTASSAAKSNPSSPTKPQLPIALSKSRPSSPTRSRTPSTVRSSSSALPNRSISRPPSSSNRPPSSLSTLSSALEKLKMLPPSRPNTSLGFNPDGSDLDSEAESTEMPRLRGRAMSVAPLSSVSRTSEKAPSTPKSTARSSSISVPKPAPFKRAATVGPSTFHDGPSGSTGAKPSLHSALMLPPPVPKGKTASVPSALDSGQQKKINLQSGIITGKPRGGFVITNGVSKNKPRIFGVGGLPGMNGAGIGPRPGGGRVVHKASKQANLPMIEGSPVKGSGDDVTCNGADKSEESTTVLASRSSTPITAGEFNSSTNPFDVGPTHAPLGSTDILVPIGLGDDDSSSTKTGDKKDQFWKDKGSRRASLASKLLAQSLSTLPQTPTKTPVTEGKGKGRAGGPSLPPAGGQSAPGALGRTVSTGSGSRVSARTRGSTVADVALDEPMMDGIVDGSSTRDSPAVTGPTQSSVRVLKGCTMFVDIRSDSGEDVCGLFVEMLRDMGAKILSRVGQTCTHIVYKNGLVSTQNRYRQLNDPKPFVVGIAWVVECAESQAKVDETKFLIDLDGVNVAGTNKRRRSMLPKLLSPSSPERRSMPPPSASGDPSSSPSSAGNTSLEDLPPLERARARRQHGTLLKHFRKA